MTLDIFRVVGVQRVENFYRGSMEDRTGLRQMAYEFKVPHRVIHKVLGVPVTVPSLPERQESLDEERLLKLLAEDYRVNLTVA